MEKNDLVPKTDDSFKFGFFENVNLESSIKAIYQDSIFYNSTSEIPTSSSFGIILDKTNFYAESGGQEYDTGKILIDGKSEFFVDQVQVFNGYVLHIGHLIEGRFELNDRVVACYDEQRRSTLRNNHTGTHILNYSLRETLGDHIDQKGSLVSPNKLRFDFSHKSPISTQDLFKIEQNSNEWIRKNVKVYSKELDLKTARKIPGLRAVFGETYPDPVRVVTLEFSVEEMESDIENPKWRKTSVEFCGGT